MITFDPTNNFDDITFGVVGSNQSYLAQFGSTTNTAYIGIYANDPMSNVGYIIGTCNIDLNTPVFQIGQMTSTTATGCNIVLVNNLMGVNTSNPGYTLDVGGDINFAGGLFKNGIPYPSGGGGGSSQWIIHQIV